MKRKEDAELGERIGGYRLVRLIGKGSTSSVFLGEHVRIGHKAAVKVLARALVDEDQVVQRLLTEAQVVNDIRHPNLIDIADFVDQRAPRRVALVMEYIQGPSLRSFRRDPLKPSVSLQLALQLLDAVGAAHDRGVVHRDIKPSNILLTFDPRDREGELPTLKVGDFGIARLPSSSHPNMTAPGTMIGTPAYMAPEQVAGSPPPSPATDVFALGEVVYEMLTGERVYRRASSEVIVRRKLRGARPPLQLPIDAPDLLEAIEGCLATKPANRPSLGAFRAEVESALHRLFPDAKPAPAASCDEAAERASTDKVFESSHAATMALDAVDPYGAPPPGEEGPNMSPGGPKISPPPKVMSESPPTAHRSRELTARSNSTPQGGDAAKPEVAHDSTVEFDAESPIPAAAALLGMLGAQEATMPDMDSPRAAPGPRGGGRRVRGARPVSAVHRPLRTRPKPQGMPDMGVTAEIPGARPSPTSPFMVAFLVLMSMVAVVGAVIGMVAG